MHIEGLCNKASSACIKQGDMTNPRRACAARVTDLVGSVCLSVCLSVKSHLTSGASVRPENAVTHSAGNEGQKFVGFSLKPLRCRYPAFPSVVRPAYSAKVRTAWI